MGARPAVERGEDKMSKTICPGQDTRFWKPEDIYEIECGKCGNVIEFFKDEGWRRCSKCGARVKNVKLAMGCAQWCEHAKECLGFDPKEVQIEDSDEISLADKLIEAMKKEFGDDQKRITHALLVFEHAQALLREEQANPRVVIAAALLHDIGIHEAERKHGSCAGKYQEIEGPLIAERIMKEIDLDQNTIDLVCHIIGCHHSGEDEASIEFKILWDADNIANFSEEVATYDEDHIRKFIDGIFKTKSGANRARHLFLDQKPSFKPA